ncbi:TetR family transcriptional regulator [Frankia sp. CcI49]|uniref:DNA-binding transcriptional regulator, AcrR family n=1 Tax=Parafrankia irregularis TaxID=795642 RepID=A0A0S4QPE0_9ACTN|nr:MULTISPECIES: TetR family transcriptional regulator [Frankiaceae]KPM52129.1 TetR family transcriptional regulator [Frankia sp. R43]MBE3200037.1 TetR family transcriptional regulator [Parafrankia sp. CH37]ONH49950.1 TetR family transcriptional regulator [Frankia sp. CcI49]CUU56776.1 DNA-binding transcriptional regulator, AcrR family [Parafrankia irregularis]
MPRPSQPLLSRRLVIETALRLIDEEGLETFSLPRLATRLQVRTPSLYHHFTDKAEILAAVAREIVLEARPPSEHLGDAWMEWFVGLGLSFRRAVLRHSNAALVLLQYLPRDVLTEVYEEAATVLAEVGVPAEQRLLIIDGLDKMVLGAVLTEAMKSPADRARIFSGVEPEKLPALATAMDANSRSAAEIYAESLRCLLRGAVNPADLVPAQP